MTILNLNTNVKFYDQTVQKTEKLMHFHIHTDSVICYKD